MVHEGDLCAPLAAAWYLLSAVVRILLLHISLVDRPGEGARDPSRKPFELDFSLLCSFFLPILYCCTYLQRYRHSWWSTIRHNAEQIQDCPTTGLPCCKTLSPRAGSRSMKMSSNASIPFWYTELFLNWRRPNQVPKQKGMKEWDLLTKISTRINIDNQHQVGTRFSTRIIETCA